MTRNSGVNESFKSKDQEISTDLKIDHNSQTLLSLNAGNIKYNNIIQNVIIIVIVKI